MVRTIIPPPKQRISFEIPKEYVGKQVEVIAFAKGEGVVDEKTGKKQLSFNALSIDTRGFKFDRNGANKR